MRHARRMQYLCFYKLSIQLSRYFFDQQAEKNKTAVGVGIAFARRKFLCLAYK
jgi:hypothetical protein|tara:strand:+ start:613 stop:771 length:159 start_codon:yes stop_codon:yes gene_type:complete